MEHSFYLQPDSYLSIEDIAHIVYNRTPVALSPASLESIQACRQFLDQLSSDNTLYYGINTGFGSLCNVAISKDELETLQSNLVLSHACGSGPLVEDEIVAIMLLLKVKSLIQGYSGVQIQTAQRLLDFLNQQTFPLVYELGSLGASGDLAPLAHLSLPLLGKGQMRHQGEIFPSQALLDRFDWEVLHLQSKEGLALLNGTQFSTAFGVWAMIESQRLLRQAQWIGALSAEAFDCGLSAYDARIHKIRRHSAQERVAQQLLQLRQESPIAQRKKSYTQDPYSFRCMPQVHGATLKALQHCREVIENEANAVTDNPNIFLEEGDILSGGNFHAQPIALVLDYCKVAMAELGNISERRTYQLISGKRELPEFLVVNPGLNSGLMIPQYLAASAVSHNKQLATPASVDSIVSSNGQEDHVSMAANAATQLYRILNNLDTVLAVELLTAAQAMEFRKPLHTSPQLQVLLDRYREKVAPLDKDRLLHDDLVITLQFLKSNADAPLVENLLQ